MQFLERSLASYILDNDPFMSSFLFLAKFSSPPFSVDIKSLCLDAFGLDLSFGTIAHDVEQID